MLSRLRSLFNREDAIAGVVLGGQSVPDGLAGGLLAGVNPIYGLYGYMFGMLGAAFVTSSEFMTVQATGAMAAVVSDVSPVHDASDPERALFTLAIMTGVVMFVAGILKLGSILRFVSNAVMVGFISGVGINIVLGQLDDFTGYEAEGSNRLARNLVFTIKSCNLYNLSNSKKNSSLFSNIIGGIYKPASLPLILPSN